MQLFPNGGSPSTKSFFVLRVDQSTLDTSTYGRLSCGPWQSSGRVVGWLGPPILSSNVPLVFVITGAGGCYSTTPSDYTAYWSGYGLNGREAAAQSGNSAAIGTTNNYFGWDNADQRFTGGLDNLRVWNRVLDAEEINTLLADPYIGCLRGALLSAAITGGGAAAPGSSAPSRFFLVT
ncbi:MAG: hypothetical protein IT518_08500 [Burkholderiales bacterium]|nr:hypothetical protein [Burkholderiales bacterium]